MAFLVSPGVQVIETDLTNVVPAVSASIGAIAGSFQWGPVEQITTVSSEKDLVSIFGKPDSDTFKYFMPAAQFLQYGNSLRVVRAATSHLNATASGVGILVKNNDDYDNVTFGIADFYVAKYPGELGNSLLVEVCDASGFASWAYKSQFSAPPGTSTFAQSVGGSNDEVHVIVVDNTGLITGQAGTVLESFGFVSQANNAKADDGTNNYYKEVLNKSSRWISWGGHDSTDFPNAGLSAAGTTFSGPAGANSYSLSGGSSDNAPSVGELNIAYSLYLDSDTVDISLLISGVAPEGEEVTHANNMIAIAEARKDCIAFVSPAISDTVGTITPKADVLEWANQLSSSSYGVIDSSALYVYDKYNDVYRWTVANGSIAGLCANTDNVADAWYSPAGFSRGQLLGVTKLAYNPNQADRDDLYLARVNPVVSFPGQGILLYGDKTAQAKPSAFDRINVRRLFIVLEKAIATASKYQLFEFNDEFTRAQFRNMVEPFLRDVKGRRGVTDFAVICDETNNTGEVVDTNRFVADIYIKPSRSINFITLNFVATRTGVEFSEIIGK